MKREGRTRELTVGITLTLALVVLASLVMMLGKEKRIFHSKHAYSTVVSNSLGLVTGSPVVMGGVQIGTVTSIELPDDAGKSGIEVQLSVDRAYGHRIREGSIASVGYITLLSGEKFINISSGDPQRPVLPEGSLLPPDTASTLLETGQNVAQNLAEVTSDMRELLEGINKGEGLVGRLLKDHEPYFGQRAVEGAEETFARTNALLERIERGEGTVGRLVSDPQYANDTLGSLKNAAARVDRVLEMVETNKGALGEILHEDGQGKQVIEDLRAAAASLKVASGRLEEDSGVIGRLLNDREYSEKIAQDLQEITTSLASITGKIDRGEGSLGLLVNDPSIAQGIQDIIGGIKSSKTAKYLLRHYGKKGAKVAAKEKAEPPPELRKEPAPSPGPPADSAPDPPGTSAEPGAASLPSGNGPDEPAIPASQQIPGEACRTLSWAWISWTQQAGFAGLSAVARIPGTS